MLDLLFEKHPFTDQDFEDLFDFASVSRRDSCTKRVINHPSWKTRDLSRLVHYASHLTPTLFDDLLSKNTDLISAMNTTLIHSIWSQNIQLVRHILYQSPFPNSRFATLSARKVGNTRIMDLFSLFERQDDDFSLNTCIECSFSAREQFREDETQIY